MSLTVFLLCFAAGLACGAVESSFAPLRRKLGLAFTVPTDIVLAFAAVALHALVMFFYTSGRIFPYAVLAEILGFVIGHAAVKSVMRRISRLFARRTCSPT